MHEIMEGRVVGLGDHINYYQDWGAFESERGTKINLARSMDINQGCPGQNGTSI